MKFYFRMMNDLARLETEVSDEAREKSAGVKELRRTEVSVMQLDGFVLGACNAIVTRTQSA